MNEGYMCSPKTTPSFFSHQITFDNDEFLFCFLLFCTMFGNVYATWVFGIQFSCKFKSIFSGNHVNKYYFNCLTFFCCVFSQNSILIIFFCNSARVRYKNCVHNQFHSFSFVEALNWQNHQVFMEYARSGATLETASFKSATRCFFPS